MKKGTKQAVFILSLIPLMYLIGVLLHSFITWQAPWWNPGLWLDDSRAVFGLITLACFAYAAMFYSNDN